MAELTFKSAGVSVREIDISQPTITAPVGVPAGIIGTSLNGPAFVPITVSSFSEFISLFGDTTAGNFGPLAAAEWLKNSQACTFIRVLGVGDGKQRNSDGSVTNAGYLVGSRILQKDGTLSDNPHANKGVGDGSDGTVEGRTYFLGCFMSESNGSTYFSDAGIQGTAAPTKASKTTTVDLPTYGTSGNPTSAGGDEFTITVPKEAGGTGTAVTIKFYKGSPPSAAANTIAVRVFGTVTTEEGIIDLLVLAINGITPVGASLHDGATGVDPDIVFANAEGGQLGTGVAGITATRSNKKIIFEAERAVEAGNDITLVDGEQGDFIATAFGESLSTAIKLVGGSNDNHAVPILRGVLLAPSGVILHLSGNSAANGSDAPVVSNTATAEGGNVLGREGSLTGSLDLTSGKQEFVLLMNGFKGSTSKPTVVTASFDPIASNYLTRVLNTDPLKIEEEGHLLYNHYPIHGNIAKVTGSGAVTAGHLSKSLIPDDILKKEDIAFLLTSSLGRKAATNGVTPDYEDFQDRFSYAKTPFVVSQKFSGKPKNLFRFVHLSAGGNVSNNFKFSIENIVRSKSDTSPYGSFDVIVRSALDNDEDKVVLESFRGVNLDPESDSYIARIIGDQNLKFDFDVNTSAQKIIVEGSHPVRSKYVRVEMSNEVSNADIDSSALPFGFRGLGHLVTSGSLLAGESDLLYITTDLLKRVVEPPVPYRDNITTGLNINKRVDNRLYWGAQSTMKISTSEPNKISTNDALASLTPIIQNFQTFYPDHRKNTTPMFVMANEGKADLAGGTILDCDKFNKNLFSLEHIKVRTGSSTDGTYNLADPENWVSASYVRDGVISTDNTTKTRKLKVEDLDNIANRKYIKFTFFSQGGFDGVNPFNKEKRDLNNNAAKYEIDNKSTQGGLSGPTISAYRKAIDIMGSKADVDIQLLAIPGLRNEVITDHAIETVENRFDCLYVMDIEERDQVNSVVTSSVQNPSVNKTIRSFKNRLIDSSFTAAYFPDVSIVNQANDQLLRVPPSVSVLGAISKNDSIGHPWFAPAGNVRGVLDSVETTKVKLNRSNLDNLYDAKINPITSFPGTPNVIWGQKTLLQSDSALDRINVRRLLISVRRAVRNVANTLLFEPNRESTLEKFTAIVNPILQNIQDKGGVSRYKVVIDSTTTTQADIENNTIRGKIFLQPTRTVEFVALDFVVSNAGNQI